MATRKASSPPKSSTIAGAIATGDRRARLEAMRARLAEETNDVTWAKHKAECRCSCGMGDGRVLVALVKELRDTIRELDSLPVMAEEESEVDRVRTAAAAKRDELAARRAHRGAGTSAS